MKSLKEWYSAKELEGLEGLPSLATNITRKAKNENWASREAKGIKGGGYEYHITSLPKKTQDQLGFKTIPETVTNELTGKQHDDLLFSFIENNFEIINDFRDIVVTAGYGGENSDYPITKKTVVEKEWLITRGLKAKDCGKYKVSGDSMDDTLKDGEDIIVNHAERTLVDGKIFVLNNQGSMLIKRVQRTFNGVELISDNNAYRPIKLTPQEADSLIVIGQVVLGYRNF
ncbi:S24 family peptidase [Pasteurella multocida]|uniref:helix-turn-helix domain-containing protein n=1 Tax=Pasteurella multocida TaxID=747 RepID=UPI002B6875E6|nr:S24 family peptidase [Pasteurella multocida]MEB3451891.1 S24 family peptidase [Pasteurella multocida]MEB3459320.1 S24 family peptidase [Pasteurella multocida]MEB3461720.1 S24 family peptidase [Pasteurella multocida]HDR1365491.1 helix-turn-helix transcriptional regulator [Pasteurella multocida]